MPSVLFVFTSANKSLTGAETGWYLPEAAHPYYILSPHADIDFASPKGPSPQIDKRSIELFKDEQSVAFLKDETAQEKLKIAKKLSEVNAADYDAIFYVGGHGPVLDLAFDSDNAKLVSKFWTSGKIVSAVCHGVAALIGAVDESGKLIINGKALTGFSNAEEAAINGASEIPFLVEDKLIALGGKYEKADAIWGAKVVVDGRLITGQNPGSATAIAETLLKALEARN